MNEGISYIDEETTHLSYLCLQSIQQQYNFIKVITTPE